MKSKQDLSSHLQTEYQDRDRRLAGSDLYSWFNTAYLFSLQQRQRNILRCLKRQGIIDLSGLRILEVGCGRGGVLQEFTNMGARYENMFGIDLLGDRLVDAKQSLPGIHFQLADGCSLPFSERSFDLVMQYTAISSVLDNELRKRMCSEMLRVVRPNGLILSYDFWLNPTNKQTRGLDLKEIQTSFPDCRLDAHRITLAPPITRRLAPVSWGLCLLLEAMKIFNTHYLVVIRPN
jgi:ubiquinone/menaquinone biosynthesis C-methylase UbiE